MNWLIELRRDLHRIPEIAFDEHHTSRLLRNQLNRIIKTHLGREAIRSGNVEPLVHSFDNSPGFLVEYTCCDSPYRLFRADMDALPVLEDTACDFKSGISGMMHACGHDIHMSVLVGLIDRVLAKQPKRNLLFLFQPAEEGKGGAESVLAEGIIQQFHIEAVFALHVASNMPVGTVSSREGIFFGIPQEFDVSFNGRSAHVAFPEQGVDAIAPAIDFIHLMKNDIAELAKLHRVIFHVGKIQGGNIRNVIADQCILEGTHRSLAKEARDTMNRLIETNAKTSAAMHGAGFVTDFLCSYDPVVNAASLVSLLQKACGKLGYLYEEASVAMTGEDFGFFTSLYPGLLFWLGSGSQHPLHSPRFLPDEDCIEVGVNVMWALVEAE